MPIIIFSLVLNSCTRGGVDRWSWTQAFRFGASSTTWCGLLLVRRISRIFVSLNSIQVLFLSFVTWVKFLDFNILVPIYFSPFALWFGLVYHWNISLNIVKSDFRAFLNFIFSIWLLIGIFSFLAAMFVFLQMPQSSMRRFFLQWHRISRISCK